MSDAQAFKTPGAENGAATPPTSLEGKARICKLMKAGWKSTGDVPFVIAHVLGLKAGTMDNHLFKFIDDILAREAAGYRDANIRKVERKTLVSPDLFDKIKEEAQKYGRSVRPGGGR
jgi:hypothetical protein